MQLISTKRLEYHMGRCGLSARALSLQAGLNETAVRDILSGRSKLTRPNTILRLASALGCKPEDLLETDTLMSMFEGDFDTALRKMKDLHIEMENIVEKSDDGKISILGENISPEQREFFEVFVGKGYENRKSYPTNFTGANLSGTLMQNSSLPGASFTGTKLVGADLSGSNLAEASFVGADLTSADLRDCNLEGADFVGCKMNGTKMKGANLAEANFTGVDMSKIDWG